MKIKFKDLEVGQKFTMENWSEDTYDVKIGEYGKDVWVHQAVESGVKGHWIKDNDLVIVVED